MVFLAAHFRAQSSLRARFSAQKLRHGIGPNAPEARIRFISTRCRRRLRRLHRHHSGRFFILEANLKARVARAL